ncbi:hypothetical protein ACIRD3_07580 [Kitasatospora sp. NPDC093550]|uniref:hypothetical protein n=1 Tax=Kitasatospora sp. NPDC093550 TaxID=3364089 RepID=UPI00382A0694
MLGIHQRVSSPAVTPAPDDLGRVGWFVLGSSVLAAAGIAHALSGLVEIAKDLVTSAPHSGTAPARTVPSAALSINERDGWILLGALLVMTGAMRHAVASGSKGIRDTNHALHRRVV